MVKIGADSVGNFRRAPLLASEEGRKVQKRVWAELEEKLESIQPGVVQTI